MKTNLRIPTLVTALAIMTFFCCCPIYAADGWHKNDSNQWTYYQNETQLKKQWISDTTDHWSYVNNSGIMVTVSSTNIDGTYDLFDENRYMQSGSWCSISKTNPSNDSVSYILNCIIAITFRSVLW